MVGMAQEGRYSEGHIRAAVAHQRSTFSDFMDRILSENSNDVRFFFHVENLLIIIYEHHLANKFISKSSACKFIPIGHSNTCKRYLQEAEDRGFIKFVRDKTDPRRENVVPTKELIAYVESKMEAAIDEARELVADVSGAMPLPNDNRPLANFPKRT